MDNYPKDYKRKYWEEVLQQAKDELRTELGVKGDIVKLILRLLFSLGFIVFGFLLIYYLGISNHEGFKQLPLYKSLIYFVLGLFLADIIGFLALEAFIPFWAHFFRRYEIVAHKDWNKTQKLKELDPIDNNIEIIVPSEIYPGDINAKEIPLLYTNGDTVHLIINNKNKVGDIEKCFARFEAIGSFSFSMYNNQVNWFKYDLTGYQKNIRWNRKASDDGTITIASEGTEVLNILEVNNEDFSFLFHNNENFSQNFNKSTQDKPYDFLLLIKLYGLLNGHRIKSFQDFYVIHLEFIPTTEPTIQGRDLSNQEIAETWLNTRKQIRLQIKKAEFHENTEIKEDKGTRIG